MLMSFFIRHLGSGKAALEQSDDKRPLLADSVSILSGF